MLISDIKMTIKAKRLVNFLKLFVIWKIHFNSQSHYLFGIWLITHINAYWVNYKKSFPFIKFRKVTLKYAD